MFETPPNPNEHQDNVSTENIVVEPDKDVKDESTVENEENVLMSEILKIVDDNEFFIKMEKETERVDKKEAEFNGETDDKKKEIVEMNKKDFLLQFGIDDKDANKETYARNKKSLEDKLALLRNDIAYKDKQENLQKLLAEKGGLVNINLKDKASLKFINEFLKDKGEEIEMILEIKKYEYLLKDSEVLIKSQEKFVKLSEEIKILSADENANRFELSQKIKELQLIEPDMKATDAFALNSEQMLTDFLKGRYDMPDNEYTDIFEDAKDFGKYMKESKVARGIAGGSVFFAAALLFILDGERMDKIMEKITGKKVPGWAKSAKDSKK